MPSSSTSRPAPATAAITISVVFRSGSPATRYPISAVRACRLASWNRWLSRSRAGASPMGAAVLAQLQPFPLQELRDVLLTAPAEVHDQEARGPALLRHPVHQRQGVRALQRRHDSLPFGAAVVGSDRLIVGHPQVLGPATLLEQRMLRPHAGVVQPSADRVGAHHLAVAVLEEI